MRTQNEIPMGYTESELKIFVALSDEKGYGITELAKLIFEDEKSKSNISNSITNLRKKCKKDNIAFPIVNLTGTRDHGKDNMHLVRTIEIFSSIINDLNSTYKNYLLKSAADYEEYQYLERHGGWADNRMMDFLEKAKDNYPNCMLFKENLDKFIYSRYTGEIIKKHGFEATIKSMPMMTVKEFITFTDWADEKEYVTGEFYANFTLGLSNGMQNYFEKYSKAFPEILEAMRSEIVERTQPALDDFDL